MQVAAIASAGSISGESLSLAAFAASTRKALEKACEASGDELRETIRAGLSRPGRNGRARWIRDVAYAYAEKHGIEDGTALALMRAYSADEDIFDKMTEIVLSGHQDN